MTKQILKQLLYIFLFILGLAFTYIFVVIILPFARDSISNDIKLKNMETELNRINQPAGSSLVSSRGVIGVLWGNGNHCDFFTRQLRQYDGDRQKILDYYHNKQVYIDFIENGSITADADGFAMPYRLDTLAEWRIDYAPANLYIVFTFHVGWDPGLDFRCM